MEASEPLPRARTTGAPAREDRVIYPFAKRDYTRLFPKAEPRPVPEEGWREFLAKRAERLFADEVPENDEDSKRVPAGYTYFGQFLTHDLTFRTEFERHPSGLGPPTNLRTPRIDLDCLYGGGPRVSPELYDPDKVGRFLIGGSENGQLARRFAPGGGSRRLVPPPADPDLLRTLHDQSRERAILPDSRNDENVILSQLHLTLQQGHNALIDRLEDCGFRHSMRTFRAARDFLRGFVQCVVLCDYLPRILDEPRATKLSKFRDGEPLAYSLEGCDGVSFRPGCLPAEFAFAVFRFGHSMVRPSYILNTGLPPIRLFPEDWRKPGFRHLAGGRPLPSNWTVDWWAFLTLPAERYGSVPSTALHPHKKFPQLARPIGPNLTRELARLPPEPGAGEERSLPVLTLMAARALNLGSGNNVATAMGQRPLPDDPFLWEYVLHEAAEQGGGRLGPLASRIVSDVLIGVIAQGADRLCDVPNLCCSEGREHFNLPALVYLKKELDLRPEWTTKLVRLVNR